MNKIEASSQLNVRNTWRVDSHVTDELGYGRYSTQIGIVQYESIHSHALISVCEDKILIVLTAHPDHPLQHRIDRSEESYCILFSDITDVVAKAASSVDAEDSSVMKTKMPRLKVFGKNRHSLHIYLKQHRACCLIDTFDGDFIVKMIVSSWQSDLIRRSAAIQPLTGSSLAVSIRKSTADYHAETVRCLKAVTRHEELMELLHDLSGELTNDLELKDLMFRSKEVMVQCLHIVQDLLSFKAVFSLKEGGDGMQQQQSLDEEILPINSNKTKIAAAAGSLARQRSRVSPSSSSSGIASPTKRFGKRGPVTRGDVLSYEEDRKLKVVAARRILIVEGIYQLFSALLFSSECLSSRFSVIIGSSPMDLQSWMDLLLPDIYDLICGALGCLDLTKEEEIKQDLALSLEQGLKLSHRSKDSSEYDTQYALAVGTPRRPLATPRMAESVLVPVSARVKALAAAAPSAEFLRAMRTLSATRNSIRDLQGVLLSQLQSVFTLSKALSRVGAQWEQQQHLSSLVGPAISSGLMQLQQYESIGDMFVRTEGWEDSLEELLIRLCSVLEDVLSSTRVKTKDIGSISRSNHASSQAIRPWSSSNAIVSRLRTSSDYYYYGPSEATTAPASAVPPSPRTKTGPRKLLPSGPPLSESTPRFNPSTPRFLTPTTPRQQQNPSTPRQNPLTLSLPLSSSVITPRDHLLHSSASASSLLMLMDINSSSTTAAAAAATTTGKLLPILPAFPKKPNLHALLGSSGSLNLQGIAEMSENEYFDSAAAALDSEPSPAASPLRTQEILLFYFVSLLQHLAKDSHRIRDVLRTDLTVHLQTMISIFNVICPRPSSSYHDDGLREYATAGSVSADKSKRDSQKTAAKSRPKRDDAHGEPDRSITDATADPLQSTSSVSSNYVKRFIRMFSAPSCNNTSVIGTSDRRGASKRPGKGRPPSDRGSSASNGMSTHRVAAATNASIPTLLLFDYGVPLYELSEPSWMLMVSARRLLEDLLVSLGVRPELITSRPNPLVRDAMLTVLAPPGKIDGIEEGGSDEEYDSPRVDPYNETASDYDGSALNTARSINDLSKLVIPASELEVPSRWNTLTTPRLSFTPRRRDPSQHSHWGRTDKDH